jgi:hypothetical protein
MNFLRRTLVAAGILACGLSASEPTRGAQVATQADLFQPTKIWDAHLTFALDQWKGLEPRQFPASGTGTRPDGETWLLASDGLRNGWTTAKGLEFNYVRATLELGGMRFTDVAVRYKGNATYSPRSIAAVKNSYKIDLNKYVKGQKLAGLSTINFHNSIADPGWMNEVLAYRLYRDAGVPAPRTAFVRVTLTVPGLYDRKYTGLYVIVENVDSNFVQAHFKSDAGTVLKPVTVKPFSDLGSDWARYAQTYDPKTDLTDAEKQRIIEFCKLVTNGSPIVQTEPPKLINARFDADPLTMFDRIAAGQRGLLPFTAARAESVTRQLLQAK